MSDEERANYLAHNIKLVQEAVCARFPFLRAPAEAVKEPARLTELSRLGAPHELLALRLQNIEARALTAAMLLMAHNPSERGGPILSLPVHDSLIVPHRAAAEADRMIRGAFEYHAKVAVRTTIDHAPDV